ncbi:MAG: OmpA family protein [Burkholderiales bacterium]|nr:OmpA family protein [Bacteroidia bacterium]
MKKLVLICACCLTTLLAMSQTEEKKWNVGFYGGITQYNGDKGMNFYQTNQPATYAFASVSISRYLSKHFDASIFFTRGELGNTEPRSPWTQPSDEPIHFLVRLNTFNALLRYNILAPKWAIRPYLYLGAGGIMHEAIHSLDKERYDYALPSFGGGLNFRLNSVVSFQLEESFMYTTADDIDGDVHGPNDGYLFHKVGLTFNLGKQKDTDGDGVSDKKDQCQNTPPGISVNAVGCPLDRDNDAIADYLDACPDIAGVASLNGCPDKDMDGITDKEDRCPDVFGPVETKGCPDADKDGIVDIDDKCAGTKTGYKVDATGCTLDNDKDGIVNEEDVCPELAGTLAFKGCPDTDGDGVSDKDDRCPTVKGTLENKGCPEIAKVDIQRITVIAGKIYFETGSAKLKLISNSSLDDLSDILKRNEVVNLTIEGHTDNVGDDAYNMTLSQQRTESVKEYLIAKGISAARLTAIGYGETKPVADNTKAAGKAKNRRVELKTSY